MEDRGPACASAETVAALSAIDIQDLARLARAIRRGVASGSLGGTRLETAFAETIKMLTRQDGGPDEVLNRFLASPSLKHINAVGNGSGLCVFEAFYNFVIAREYAEPQLIGQWISEVKHRAQHEFCNSILRFYAATPFPAFRIGSRHIRSVDNGCVAILSACAFLPNPEVEPPAAIVYAAVRERFWSGSVSSEVAAAIAGECSPPPAWAEKSSGTQAAARIVDHLRNRGLL